MFGYLYKAFIFAIFSEYDMYTHNFKVFANIVYPVQIITSEVIIILDDFDKKKK